jgi:hypothetical protein
MTEPSRGDQQGPVLSQGSKRLPQPIQEPGNLGLLPQRREAHTE